MGDRGNIAIRQNDGTYIYLYTHWCGSRLPAILRAGLTAGISRIDDAPYLTRIIIDTMSAAVHDPVCGMGVSTRRGDNENDMLIVNVAAKRVSRRACNAIDNENAQPVRVWTFAEFMADTGFVFMEED